MLPCFGCSSGESRLKKKKKYSFQFFVLQEICPVVMTSFGRRSVGLYRSRHLCTKYHLKYHLFIIYAQNNIYRSLYQSRHLCTKYHLSVYLYRSRHLCTKYHLFIIYGQNIIYRSNFIGLGILSGSGSPTEFPSVNIVR